MNSGQRKQLMLLYYIFHSPFTRLLLCVYIARVLCVTQNLACQLVYLECSLLIAEMSCNLGTVNMATYTWVMSLPGGQSG